MGSAVFQDFVRFTLPVRDNVGFGALEHIPDEASRRGALRRAISGLADRDLGTWLGREFGGRDLSGGEWLPVALARGVADAPATDCPPHRESPRVPGRLLQGTLLSVPPPGLVQADHCRDGPDTPVECDHAHTALR